MRAAVMWGVGEKFDVNEDVQRRDPGLFEAVVHIHATGVCQTDLTLAGGAFGHPLPAVFGHEGAGVVVEVGDRVTKVEVGDRVVVNWVPPCDKCVHCVAGRTNHCLNRTRSSQLGGKNRSLTAAGKPVSAGMSTATFAEETVIPENGLVKLDQDVPFPVASLFGCSMTTGVGAALNSAKVQPGQTVLVMGCGPIGLNAIQGARIAGAAAVVGVDPLESRRNYARTFGADYSVGPDELADLGDIAGIGFDVVIDAVGAPQTMETSWRMARRGGTIVMVGAGRAAEQIKFSAYELFHDEKIVVGSYYGSTDLRREVPRLTALWRSGRLIVDPFISESRPLFDINEVVMEQRSGDILRRVLIP